jgi:hypothetical protein
MGLKCSVVIRVSHLILDKNNLRFRAGSLALWQNTHLAYTTLWDQSLQRQKNKVIYFFGGGAELGFELRAM